MKKIMKNIMTIVLVVSIMTSVAIAGQVGLIDPDTKGNISTKNVEDIKTDLISSDKDVRVIITLKDVASDSNIESLKKRVGTFTVGKKGWDKAYPKGFAAVVKNKQIDLLANDPLVERVDKDERKEVQLETATYWSGATKARNETEGYGVTGDMNGNPYNYTPEDIVIAVVDTGIDPMHKDLTGLDNGGTGKIIGWYDAVNNRASPYDDHGHGTHVSSIAAGEGSDNPRYKGVAPGAALVGVKVCSSYGWCYDSDMIDGINWIINNKSILGIEIMTMSIGGDGSSDGLDPVSAAVNKAVDAGLVATIAAGNSGPQKYTISSPGSAAKAITVAAMADPGYQLIRVLPAGISSLDVPPTNTDTRSKPAGQAALEDNGFYLAPWSSRGPTADNRIKPDISAPGVAITAAMASYPNTASYHGGYATWSGTSMATPFIAGVAALMLAADPALTPQQVKDYIRNSAEDYGATGCDIDYGCGRVRTMKAIEKATGIVKPDKWVPTHIRTVGVIGDNDFRKIYSGRITDTTLPFAATLIMNDWSGYDNGIDLDIAVFDPANILIAGSYRMTRQETLVIYPDSTGKYNTSVSKYAGSGRYALDRSFK